MTDAASMLGCLHRPLIWLVPLHKLWQPASIGEGGRRDRDCEAPHSIVVLILEAICVGDACFDGTSRADLHVGIRLKGEPRSEDCHAELLDAEVAEANIAGEARWTMP